MSNSYDLTWLDTLAVMWANVDGGGFGKIHKSYKVSEFPASITDVPCAVTYPPTLNNPQYGSGTAKWFYWSGMTVFHLSLNLNPENLRLIPQFMIRIVEAAVLTPRLGTDKGLFLIAEEPAAVEPLEGLTLGSEAPHHGVSVRWTFSENIGGKFTIGN